MVIKRQLLQDPYLNALRRDRIQVSMYLVNGIRLVGVVQSFDAYTVLLKSTGLQAVFKHAISTIVPTREVNMAQEDAGKVPKEGAEDAPPPSPSPVANDKGPRITTKRTRLRSSAA